MSKEDQGRKELFDQSIDNWIDKDVLLFQGSILKGVNSFTGRSNQHAVMKGTREQHEGSSRRLSSAGLCRMETIRGNNGKEFIVFNKASVLEISENPKVLDKFVTLGIKFSQHKECRRDEMISPIPQSLP